MPTGIPIDTAAETGTLRLYRGLHRFDDLGRHADLHGVADQPSAARKGDIPLSS